MAESNRAKQFAVPAPEPQGAKAEFSKALPHIVQLHIVRYQKRDWLSAL